MRKFIQQNLFGMTFVCLSLMPLQSHAAEPEGSSGKIIFPDLAAAQLEISRLNENVTAIESRYEKEFADLAKQINQAYAEKLVALKNEHRDEAESPAEFKIKQEIKRDELIGQRDNELAKLNPSKASEAEILPLKAKIRAFAEHEYLIGAEGVQVELGEYDQGKHQFTLKLASKITALNLKVNDVIPLPEVDAQKFLQQWQSGLIKPEAKAKINGDLIELVLVNEADHSRWIELQHMFFSPETLRNFAPAKLNDLFQIGRAFKDCPSCPDMVVLPAGSFDMGSNSRAGNEKPVHRVTFKQPFAMGKTEVTQGEWKAVMGTMPSYFKNCGVGCPVEQVSWIDAKEFIQKLNAKTGKQYSLPSEAEWEYACRAGGQQEFCGDEKVDNVAWNYKNSGGFPHAVAQKQANSWGLYDMSGNVWEWVEDSYHADYSGAPTDGSVWQGDAAQRVLRGGSWNLISELVRAAVRSSGVPVLRDYYYGFRVVRSLL